MENNLSLMIPEGAGTMSPRYSSQLSRSNLSRTQSFRPGMSGNRGSLIYRHGNGASAPSFRPSLGESFLKNSEYTSLKELADPDLTIRTSYTRSESFGPNSPRTPLKNTLVEKAACAYLQPSVSFGARTPRTGWGMCLFNNTFFSDFIARFSSAFANTIQFFCCPRLQWPWISLSF